MKQRMGVLLVAAAAIMLLTAGTARQAYVVGPMSDHQQSQVIGGEKEKSCTVKYEDAWSACSKLTTELEIQTCRGVASLELAACTVGSFFSWLFSLLF